MEENKWKMELRQKAENLKDRRRSAKKVVGILWNMEGKEEEEGQDMVNMKTVKEMELTKAAEKFELKRKVSGKWVAMCKQDEEKENN